MEGLRVGARTLCKGAGGEGARGIMLYLATTYKHDGNGRILAREEWVIIAKSEGEAKARLAKTGLVVVGIRAGESCQLARLSSRAL